MALPSFLRYHRTLSRYSEVCSDIENLFRLLTTHIEKALLHIKRRIARFRHNDSDDVYGLVGIKRLLESPIFMAVSLQGVLMRNQAPADIARAAGVKPVCGPVM